MRVLVTGLIGSGKSAVCAILHRKGYPVYDSDSRAKALYLREDFARRVECEVGVPIKALGSIFSHPDRLQRLEALVHPEVLKDFNEFCESSGSGIVFFESALAGTLPLFRGQFDKVILVRAAKEKRWMRNEKASDRDNLQKEPTEFDFLIENDGSLEDLEEKVNVILSQL